ncbi:MAG TPA: hypothetical protein VM689_13905 [Aliidongia sp.]|nr:hypothetical protein [Aliidongia sp.]
MSFSASSAVAEECRDYPFRSGEQPIGYEAIASLELTKVKSQLFPTIRHAGGTARSARSMLPSPADFDESRAVLTERGRFRR